MERRKTALAGWVLIVIALLALFHQFIGFFTIVALVLIFAGVYKMQKDRLKKGYMLAAIGGVLLVLDNLFLFIGITLISLGIFYYRSRMLQPRGMAMFKQNFMSNYKWDEVPWTLRNASIWHVLGEMDADLSLALPEERETVFYMQGILGDIDFWIPEYYGVEVEAVVVFGQIQLGGDTDVGVLNRLVWKSPNYAESEYKVKFIVSYVAGDVRFKFI
jgi:lia operon protein LiaF